eukprot:6478735-Amphidinium_carterae.1
MALAEAQHCLSVGIPASDARSMRELQVGQVPSTPFEGFSSITNSDLMFMLKPNLPVVRHNLMNRISVLASIPCMQVAYTDPETLLGLRAGRARRCCLNMKTCCIMN